MSEQDETRYVLQVREGDYVKSVEGTGMETVPLQFHFTKDHREAKRFTYNDLYSQLSVNPIGMHFTRGYAGGRLRRVKAKP